MLGLNPSEQEVVDIPNQIARKGITIIVSLIINVTKKTIKIEP